MRELQAETARRDAAAFALRLHTLAPADNNNNNNNNNNTNGNNNNNNVNGDNSNGVSAAHAAPPMSLSIDLPAFPHPVVCRWCECSRHF
jgi:hypothetical protein